MLELHHFVRMGSTRAICARCEVPVVLADARSALALDREETQEPRAEAEPEARVRATGCGAARLGGPETRSGSQAGGDRSWACQAVGRAIGAADARVFEPGVTAVT